MTNIDPEKSDETTSEESSSATPQMTFAEFLENVPPNQEVSVSDIAVWKKTDSTHSTFVNKMPEIQLHCSNEACNGTRFFRCVTEPIYLPEGQIRNLYLTYACSNCQKALKIFAICMTKAESGVSGSCFKYGEYPPFGPPTPSRLIKLIGPDRDLFLKGRRCENQGLGIGAFVYYRRVVENQKNRIFDEIIKVAKKLNAPSADIKELEDAKNETQFSNSLSMVKQAIPQALLIDGHNPLLLLHKALSKGVHNKSDEECLKMASSVRVVLAELSERLGQALKDEAELNHALTTLMTIKE